LGQELTHIDKTENKAYLEWLFKFFKNNRKELGITNVINEYGVNDENKTKEELEKASKELSDNLQKDWRGHVSATATTTGSR